MQSFHNQSVIITGAGSGIGKASAIEFAIRGAKVIVSDINEKAGQTVVETITTAGGKANFIKSNVSKSEEIQYLLDQTLKLHGHLDHMINNAGIGRGLHVMDEITDDHWDDIIAINQTGVFYCMRAALKIMKQQERGNIVNTASIAGLHAAPQMGAYCASKHAVVGMTKTAAAEYGKYNIRINAVCPTVIKTPMGDDYLSGNLALSELIRNTIPMKRFGEATEVAKTICWLCSDDASFINGEAIHIDGGMKA